MSESQPDACKTKRNFGRSDSGSAGSLTPAGERIVADLAVGLDAIFGKPRRWICQCAGTMGDFGYQCSFCGEPCNLEWGV